MIASKILLYSRRESLKALCYEEVLDFNGMCTLGSDGTKWVCNIKGEGCEEN